MPLYPTLKETTRSKKMTEVFGGYNHNLKIAEGELYDMENLTGKHYPLLASRDKRGTVRTLANARGLLAKSTLAYIDGQSLYYGNDDLTSYLTAAGASIAAGSGARQMVSMGAYICIFPDKLYINTENYSDCGSMEAEYSSTGSVSYSMCRADGSAYAEPTVSADEPESPANGALWIDTSATPHALKSYSSATAAWVETATVHTKISATGISESFSVYDGVEISGCEGGSTADVQAQVSALNGSKVIYDRGDDYIVIVGLIDEAVTQSSGSVTVKRSVPDADFITEAENRLWGCRYGQADGETVNEIFCCALGDFKNWSQYQGLSTDSYRASVGTDGPFTGAVTHLGYPIFFKENVMHKVYISPAGAHQITATECRGVQSGSSGSLCVVNERLYYKSATDVCAYDGSLPMSVSEKLGDVSYSQAAAGAIGDRYYISMRNAQGDWSLFALDTAKGLWHREDTTQALFFARCGEELYCVTANGQMLALCGTVGGPEGSVSWSAETGMMGQNYAEHKYVSRLNIRMSLEEGAGAEVYLEYDSDGIWRLSGHIKGLGSKSFLLPIRPRRCDHFRVKIEGRGEMRIYSISRILERGSDV